MGLPVATNAILLAVILVLALLGTEITRRVNATEARTRMDEIASRVVRRISERINLYHYGLRGLGASVQAVGYDRFRGSTSAVTAVPATSKPNSRRAGFDQARPGRRNGILYHRSTPRRPPHLHAARDRTQPGERWMIQYIDPESNNLGAEGLDIASEPNRAQPPKPPLQPARRRSPSPSP
jgi:hypothetical protein